MSRPGVATSTSHRPVCSRRSSLQCSREHGQAAWLAGEQTTQAFNWCGRVCLRPSAAGAHAFSGASPAPCTTSAPLDVGAAVHHLGLEGVVGQQRLRLLLDLQYAGEQTTAV